MVVRDAERTDTEVLLLRREQVSPEVRLLGNRLRPWTAQRAAGDVTGPLTVSATVADMIQL